MSKFLAPIHSWLFNKIKLYEELESLLVKSYSEKYGKEVDVLYTQISDKLGHPLADKPLEDLIDVSNIHGWLQNKISLAETRQAALITNLYTTHGEEVKNIAIDLYSKQGATCGEEEKSKIQVDNASEIYQALNNYILEGMPCDRANVIMENSQDKIEWKNEMCLHKNYWESVGGDINTFYRLRDIWIKAFVESVNNDFTYNTNRVDSIFSITQK